LTVQEDSILKELIQQFGIRDWHIISKKLNQELKINNWRNQQQCKER